MHLQFEICPTVPIQPFTTFRQIVKALKICNYSTVRLLPLLFRCGWLKRVAEIEIKRVEGTQGGGREGGGVGWREGGRKVGERCWQLPKPSCLSRCQSNCCTLTTAQIREPGISNSISNKQQPQNTPPPIRPQAIHQPLPNSPGWFLAS